MKKRETQQERRDRIDRILKAPVNGLELEKTWIDEAKEIVKPKRRLKLHKIIFEIIHADRYLAYLNIQNGRTVDEKIMTDCTADRIVKFIQNNYRRRKK